MGKIKIGFAPTRRHMYDPAYAINNKKIIRQEVGQLVADYAEIKDIDWLNEEGILTEIEDVPKVERYFREADIDALFMPHCNFGTEEVVGKLGKAMDKPLLLWGPRDAAPPKDNAIRQTDTQCGLFASSKVLIRYGVPFTYIENSAINSDVFKKGLEDFIRTAAVVRTFRHMRIGQISLRPKPFLSVMINEGELLEKFGIEIVPILDIQIQAEVEKIQKSQREEIDAITNDITTQVDCTGTQLEQIRKIAAIELAIMKLAEENDCNAMASECWMSYYHMFDVGPCFLFGDVTERGLPVACENDIHGAVTSALLSAAALGQTPPFLADLTIRHPENDNAELLWHCGPFPKSLAKDPSRRKLKDFKGQWELKGGEITIARFDGCRGNYSFFAGQGVGVDGPSTNGNYLWVQVNDWPKWERKFIYGPYIHHVAAIHGQYASILHEACKYLGEVTPDTV